MERNYYDLTSQTHTCGKIGRLQTLAVYPTLPGDSFELNLDGIIRLAPLRKEVVSESIVDLLAFYVPHRHVYGQSWIDFVMRGNDENITFTGIALNAEDRTASFLTLHEAPATIPTWLLEGYNRIWDRYFRVPSFDPDTNFQLYPTGPSQASRDWRLYGRTCARLPHPTNLGIRVNNVPLRPHRDLTSADATLDVSGGSLDIRALEQVRGIYRSEIERTWFAERYTDVLDIWGASVNVDADQRPELLMRQTIAMSGVDVDGADDATLGTYIGKTVAGINFGFPRKYFDEHGAIWIMALVRFPMIHCNETHPLLKLPNPSPASIMGDPNVLAESPPITFVPADWLSTTGIPSGWTDANIVQAAGNQFRVHNNNVHWHFKDLPGYPFVKQALDDPTLGYYHAVGEYDDVFQTSQLGHWQIHAKLNMAAYRHVPEPMSSIFAGAS